MSSYYGGRGRGRGRGGEWFGPGASADSGWGRGAAFGGGYGGLVGNGGYGGFYDSGYAGFCDGGCGGFCDGFCAVVGDGENGGGEGQKVKTALAAEMAALAPPPSTIRRQATRVAEAAAQEVALRVHPTEEAERRRQDVIGYLRRVIGSALGSEVFAFGSVPLKTYLPDGDVDITVLANTWLNPEFIYDVRSVLEAEQTCDAEFEVKGFHIINAEVKLIKCIVENIVVDISFNQIGGVSTFCFLELVDRRVGKNHLFKRSIMLIKAWCYHESRILGAHHGLLSTYALETLVLYIFNFFHKSLHGPLEALYRFLEYFCKFDWDKYGISLNGPVNLSSLPNLSVDPTAAQDELLFGTEFLQASLDRLVVISSSNGCDTNFRRKHLNIIDPLKGSNNLGRSVSKASYYRIRSAFSFGAQKLGQILMLPSEFIPDEIFGFFANTLKRHGKGERPDLGDYSSFEFLVGSENAPGEGLSSLKMIGVNGDENGRSCHSSELASKEVEVADMHKNAGMYLPGNVQDLPWDKIWPMEYPSDLRGKSSYVASFRNHSSFSQQNGKELLPPFSQSSMLDLSGDLDFHLGCLRKVQYHLENLFDELLHAVQEVCLAGVIDEDSFKLPTVSLVTRPQTIPLYSSTDMVRRQSSPVPCYHSTGDVSQKWHAEDQGDVDCQQNSPFSSNGLPQSLSPESNSDNYPASWFCISPTSQGTGTYIPKFSYDMYKERMTPEKGYMAERGRRQKQKLGDPHYYSPEQGRSGSTSEHTAVQGTTNRLQSSQQDGNSSKGVVPIEDFPPLRVQVATVCGMKQTATDLPKVQKGQSISASPAIEDANKDSLDKGRQTKPPPSGVVLPQFGQGNPSASKPCQPSSTATSGYHQLKARVDENLEFGSMGPFSLGLLSAKFEEAFPPLPASKKPAEVPAVKARSPEPVATQSRPQEVLQLRDEAEFPPLQAGCR